MVQWLGHPEHYRREAHMDVLPSSTLTETRNPQVLDHDITSYGARPTGINHSLPAYRNL